MKQGTIRWQVPLGSMQYFGKDHGPIPPGSIGFGGPIVTASGLAFIAGRFDPYILRCRDWKGIVESAASGKWKCHSNDLQFKWQAILDHRLWRSPYDHGRGSE
jgi:glucose dehydrogenase